MKKIILITMLMSAVFAQSDCNKNNWRDYYNSDGKDMSDCDLRWRKPFRRETLKANLAGANLTGATLIPYRRKPYRRKPYRRKPFRHKPYRRNPYRRKPYKRRRKP